MLAAANANRWLAETMSLYHGDFFDKIKNVPDGSVHLVLVDLPYGTTACSWDSIIPLAPMWEQVKRVMLPNGVFMSTASQPFTSVLISSNLEMFKYEWSWDKGVGTGFLSVQYRPLMCHESVCVFYDKQPTFNPQKWQGKKNHVSNGGSNREYSAETLGRTWTDKNRDTSGMKYPRSVLSIPKFATVENEHPTQKPVALCDYLIRTYTNPGDVVLDFCMGSGTTGVAAVQTGREFIGIEKERKYFVIAEKRIGSAHPPLFTEQPPRQPTPREPDKGDSPRQSSFINPEADTAQGALS